MHTNEELAQMSPSNRRAMAVIDYVMDAHPTEEQIVAWLDSWDKCYEVMVFAHMAQDARMYADGQKFVDSLTKKQK